MSPSTALRRRRAVALLIVPSLVALTAFAPDAPSSSSSTTVRQGDNPASQQRSARAALDAGVPRASLDAFVTEAAAARLPWQVLAALATVQTKNGTTVPGGGVADGEVNLVEDAGSTSQRQWSGQFLIDTSTPGAPDTSEAQSLPVSTRFVAKRLAGALRDVGSWNEERSILDQENQWVAALDLLPVWGAGSSTTASGAPSGHMKRVYDLAASWIRGQACPQDSATKPGASVDVVALTGSMVIGYKFHDGAVLNDERMANAQAIARTAISLGMNERALALALATAKVESQLVNVTGGDRDSVGLFQQRPSQGWGTVAQIMDPQFATTSFLTRLVRVPGWETIEFYRAAQAVQRSAFPTRYGDWEVEMTALARALLSALGGEQPAGSGVTAPGSPTSSSTPPPAAAESTIVFGGRLAAAGASTLSEKAPGTTVIATDLTTASYLPWIISTTNLDPYTRIVIDVPLDVPLDDPPSTSFPTLITQVSAVTRSKPVTWVNGDPELANSAELNAALAAATGPLVKILDWAGEARSLPAEARTANGYTPNGVSRRAEFIASELGDDTTDAPGDSACATSRSAVITTGIDGSDRPPADRADIVSAAGILVHQDIASNVEALVAAAAADGVTLKGGGYRDPAAQIATRRRNCGSSDYAIYQAPSTSCSPPTARPGQSMHERGLAIDFENCSSHSTACWQWLNDHAGEYGLRPFTKEPWHWSTNGR